MKRLFLILCCALTAWQLHAQFAAIAAYAPKYSPGKVWFQDGHSEEFAAVETPNCMQKKLTVSHDEKRKEKQTLNVADITAVTLWHKDHPDKTFTLVHILTQTSMVNMVPDQWGFPIAQSAWGMAVLCYPSYSFNKKSGELEGILLSQTSSNGMVNRQPILTFLRCRRPRSISARIKPSTRLSRPANCVLLTCNTSSTRWQAVFRAPQRIQKPLRPTSNPKPSKRPYKTEPSVTTNKHTPIQPQP